MKTRITLMSGLLTLAAASAMAVPTSTTSTSADPAPDSSTTAWSQIQAYLPSTDSPPSFSISTPAPATDQLALFGPCGCIPIPGCPFPISMPGGPTIFNPFPPIQCCPSPF